jgi:hypothetical protein
VVLPALLRDPARGAGHPLHPRQAGRRDRHVRLAPGALHPALRPLFKQFFWLFVIDTIILGWVGANPPEGWFLVIGRIATAYYFAHFIIVLPVIGLIERPRPLPQSIAEPVLEGGGGPQAAPQAAREKP